MFKNFALDFCGKIVPLHDDCGAEAPQNMLLFVSEGCQFVAIFLRCALWSAALVIPSREGIGLVRAFACAVRHCLALSSYPHGFAPYDRYTQVAGRWRRWFFGAALRHRGEAEPHYHRDNFRTRASSALPMPLWWRRCRARMRELMCLGFPIPWWAARSSDAFSILPAGRRRRGQFYTDAPLFVAQNYLRREAPMRKVQR